MRGSDLDAGILALALFEAENGTRPGPLLAQMDMFKQRVKRTRKALELYDKYMAQLARERGICPACEENLSDAYAYERHEAGGCPAANPPGYP